jgi:hypothetical protein
MENYHEIANNIVKGKLLLKNDDSDITIVLLNLLWPTYSQEYFTKGKDYYNCIPKCKWIYADSLSYAQSTQWSAFGGDNHVEYYAIKDLSYITSTQLYALCLESAKDIIPPLNALENALQQLLNENPTPEINEGIQTLQSQIKRRKRVESIQILEVLKNLPTF